MITGAALTTFLGWCTLINFGVLLLWFVMMLFMRDFVVDMHSKIFHLSKDEIAKAHYNWMANYKISLSIFNFVPYVVLKIMGF